MDNASTEVDRITKLMITFLEIMETMNEKKLILSFFIIQNLKNIILLFKIKNKLNM